MTSVLHIADSFAGAIPYRCEELAEDSWLALGHVQRLCAHVNPDILLHSGGVFGSNSLASTRRFCEWAEAVSWGGGPPLVLTWDASDAADVRQACADFDWVSPDSGPLRIAGIEIRHIHHTSVADTTNRTPTILAGNGIVAGTYGTRRATLTEADWRQQSTYTALGGVPRPQLVSDHVAYAGSVTPVDLADVAGAWVSLVDLGSDAQSVRQITRYKLPSRARELVRLDLTWCESTEQVVQAVAAKLHPMIVELKREMPAGMSGGPLLRADVVVMSDQASADLEDGLISLETELHAAGLTYVELRIRSV